MTFSSDGSPNEEPKDSLTLVVIALIQALHEKGTLPAQAVADVLDRRAVNAALRSRTGDEATVRQVAVVIQTLADQIETQTPFRARDQDQPPTEGLKAPYRDQALF